jgi:hypothetical protein
MSRVTRSGQHRPRAALLLIVGALTAAGFVVLGVAQPWNALRPSQGITVGAYVVNVSDTTIVLTLTGPVGPGKGSGSTITTRISGTTEFAGGLRRGQFIGPTVPVVAVISPDPEADGSYRLISLTAQVR